jgi:hypothetical protein
MQASSLTTQAIWAQEEFGAARLGDKRRTKRLVKVARAIATSPQGTLPGSYSTIAELKAAYKLLSYPQTTREAIVEPHLQRTREALDEPGEFFLIEDTTYIDYTKHKAVEGLGPIGNGGGRGLVVHTTLCLQVVEWKEHTPTVDVLGLLDQQCWVRPPESRRSQETGKERLYRPRESQCWARCLLEHHAPDQAKWTFIADRESDIYECFERCRNANTDFIIRAARPRALAGGDQDIFETISQAPVRGQYQLHLRKRDAQEARTATITVRATRLSIRGPWRPGRKCEPFELNVIEAREENPPKGSSAIHWVLLTTLPIDTFKQIRKVIAAYATRWLIEEYHKALKTGTKIEDSELATAQRLMNLLGILSVVAVRLLRLKMAANAAPEDPIVTDDEVSCAMISVLESKRLRPSEGWTNRTLLIAIAKLGGFLGRKSDGNPGWLTIWRGLQQLMLLTAGFLIAQQLHPPK